MEIPSVWIFSLQNKNTHPQTTITKNIPVSCTKYNSSEILFWSTFNPAMKQSMQLTSVADCGQARNCALQSRSATASHMPTVDISCVDPSYHVQFHVVVVFQTRKCILQVLFKESVQMKEHLQFLRSVSFLIQSQYSVEMWLCFIDLMQTY